MVHVKYAGMFLGRSQLSPNTQKGLERTIGRSLFGRTSSRMPLRRAVFAAASELRTQGLTHTAILDWLSTVVEDAGRACGADRPSLLSREPRWIITRTVVLDAAMSSDAEFRGLVPVC